MRYILAIALVLQVWIGLSDAIAGGYVNCFSENIRQRHFSVSPGSYNPDKMEPNYCRERCGAFDYLYAALAHGKFCFCSQTLPVGKNVTNTPCNMTCEGNPSEICGSRNYVSVFRSISAITGLEVTSNVSGILTVPASIGLSISVNSGNNILYMVDYGDTSGSTVGNETDYDSRQIYRPGQYVVKVGAQDVDKTMPVSYAVTGFTLEQTVESVDILCDPAFATYEEGECVVTVWKGTDLMMDANFTDRHPYDVRLEYIADPIVSIAGTWVPNPPTTTPSTGAYVMRAAEFTTSGKIYGWRMHVQTAGQIKIYVLSPSCTTTSTTYCYESNSCKASCLTTSKSISTACSASDAFCGQSGKCYATCSSTASRYGTTQINVDSYVINQTITFNPTTTGTKWFDQSPYLDVEPGFVLGVDHSVTGRISEMSAPINDITFSTASFAKAVGTLYTSTHALQAYYSSGSKVLLKFTFLTNPIIFPMAVTVYNRKQATTATNTTYINLFEGVDFAIIEGPLYVAANEPALFTLANHTGSNLTYIWNITDGSPIGSLPYLNHTFLTKGDYNISVAVFNVISRKDNYTTVHVQNRITGLVITAVDSPVNTLVNLNVALATGSDFTCKLTYGDGNPPVDLTPLDITIPTSVQTHEYLDIGFYTVVIFCENMINNATSKVDIYIEEPITNLRAAREGAPTLEAFRFGWLLDSGSNVNFQLTFNGASLAIDPAASDVNSYVWESVIVPGKPANGYPYFLQASNKITSLNISGYFIVMDKIENPSISASSHNVTTDDNVYFTIDMTKGSDVHILIDFQDSSIPYNYSAKPPGSPWAGAMVLNRTFINGCTCTVTATIWNAASTFTVTVDVLVLVGFSAFSWDLDPWNYYLYEPPALVAFKFTSSSPASPTDPTVVVDWGDGIKPVVENAIRVGAPGYSRELDDTLDFEITVTMSNMMGSKVYRHKAIVVEKLVGPAITTQYTDAPLNQPLNVTFSLYRGDNQELTNLTWDFGDGNGSFTVDRMGVGKNAGDTQTVIYTTTGPKVITVIARAPLGQMVSATKTMQVVNAINSSALVITVAGDVSFGNPTVFILTYNSDTIPNSVTITIDYFGDGSSSSASYPFNINTNGGTQQISQTYTKPGSYMATITVENTASKVVKTVQVGVYQDFVNLKAKVTYTEYQPSALPAEKNGINGLGVIYPLDAPIKFTLSDDNNALATLYSIVSTSGPVSVFSNSTFNGFDYNFTAVGNYTLAVTAKNPLFSKTVSVTIQMVKRVRSMTIKEEKKDVAPGQSKNFNFTFTDYGQDTCVYIDWGVSGKSSKFGNNINTCTDTNFASAKAEGDMGLLTTQLIGNTYYAEGVYTMKATATNAYGQDYQEITFTISNIKCSKPFVYIDLAQTLAYKATKYLRSSIIRLRGMAVISCPNAVDNTKSWRLESVDSTTGQTIASIDMTGLDTDKGELYIPAKFLKIGFYKAIYTMVMLDGEAGPNTIFNNSAYTYFQVGKSDLVAIMTDGGMSEITRGSKQMVTLEPLKWSFDPDEDVGAVQGLSLSKWTCTVVTTNGDQTTCNKFSTTAQTQNVAGSALIQGYTYRLEATLTKDTRTALAVISVVINGTNPPIPVIRCTEGSVCYPRTGGYTILESGRVSLDCQCPTCNLTAAYKWSVFIEDYRWNDGWRPLKDIEVIEHSINADGLVSKQFTIEKTLFSRYSDETTIFRTQCSIADVAGNSSTSTSLYVNKPPTPGNCSIEPANATATPDASQLWLINCWDWYDENGIKEFQFYSMTDPDDLQKEITSIPMGASEYGVINNQKVSIPIGPSYNGYKQTVMVVVKDMLNAARTVTVAKISVFPPDKALIRQYMNSILADPTSNFFKVCKEGDQRMVTEMAASVLSGLNQDASDSKKDFSSSEVPSNMICTGYGPNDADRPNAYKNVSEDRSMVTQYEFDKLRDQRAKLRTDIVKLTGTLSCKDPISIQQCAGLLAQATAEPTEVTVECQGLVMDRLNTMLNYLMDDKMMAFVSQEDKEKAMRSIFSALGSVMEAAGSNGFYPTLTELKATQKEKSWFKYDTSLTATEDPLNLDVESARSDDEALKYHTRNVHKAVYADTVKAINQQTDATLQKLAKLFSSFAIPGQWQNSTTSRLKYTMQKNFASKFAGASVQPPNSDATILFPNTTADLFPGNFQTMKNQVVTFQLSQTTNYPDRYTPVALEGIYSYTHFLNIELYDSSGQPLKIENTTKPIKITIPHDSQGPRGGIKPIRGIVTGWNLFQLHQTETKSHGSSIHLRFQLVAGTQLLVVVRYGEVPDPANNLTDFIFVVPPTVPPSPKLKDPYTILIDNVAVAGRKGKWYIGTRERNATYRNTPAPTNQEIVERYKKGAGEFINDYNLTIWTSGCFFHTVNASDWSNKGCVVSSESSQEKTVCLCNHLTTFAGGFIVVPNVIDWNYVFANADFLSNPTLYLTEIFIAVIFSIAFFLARRKDKRDMSLLGLAPLADNDPRDKYYYEIIVSTGMRRNAGTDSKVFFILSGEDDESDVRAFTDTKRPIFKKGMTNGFLMATPECLGRINYMRVWHDNSGKGKFGSWFLNYITVRDLQTDVKQVFIANRWFALEEDDGQIDRIIPLAGKEQLQDFSYQFSERSKKNLADGHLWFSVVARPPGSRFTCVQRVACCLCLLFMTMLTNAMFYNTTGSTSTSASTSFEFGPFSLSVSQIFIGFISTVIVFPVNFLLVFLFRKAQPRHKRPSRVQLALAGDTRPGTARLSQVNPQMDSEFTRSTTSLATTVSMPDVRSDKEKLVKDAAGPSSPIPSESPSSSTVSAKKKSLQLPWWCQIVAWVILVLCTIMSVALVTFYGISFKDETCKKWITSLIISFFTSVFITQPIKVILTAIFLSLIIRNPGEDEDDEESDEEAYPMNTEDGFMHTDIDGSFAAARPKKVGYKPPNPKEIERMREIRLKEVKMWAVIREILFYSMFLWILLIIAHKSRGPDNWRFKNTMDRTFIKCLDYKPKFTDVGNIDDFWKWIGTSFLSGIMASSYYNDYPPLRLRSYVNDKSSRILGHATMRQLRVKADQCDVPKTFRSMIRECNVPYTIFDQEERDFDVGWAELGPNKTGVKNSGYTWSTAESLNSYPYVGVSALYSGGGYTVHLTGSRTQMNDTFKRLASEKWIDRYTRAVFIEFTVYNPQVNLFSINTMLIELDVANGLQPTYRFEPAMLLTYMDNAMIFLIVCEVLFVIYIIVFIVIEIRQFIKLKGQYFFQFWTWMELSTIGCSIGAVVIYFYRMFETNKLLKEVKESDGHAYTKFQYVGYWNEMFSYLVGFVVFLATIKFLRLLRFNRRISMLSDTLQNSGKQLIYFSVIFWVILMAFTQAFYLTFRNGDDNYDTFIRSATSLLLMLMGKFSIVSMSNVEPVLSQVYILVYVVVLAFVILNMFVSILTDSFSAVRRDVQSQTNDYEIVDFMIGRLKKWTGLGTQPSTTIDPNVNKTLDGYANDDEEDEDKFDEAINPNMAMFPSRIDKLLNSLSAIYQENDSLAGLPKPWMKQPYQAPPRCDQLSFRPPSTARDRFRPPSSSQDGSRPTSAVRFRPPSSSQDGSRPTSAVRDNSRPTSGAQKRRSSLSKVETS